MKCEDLKTELILSVDRISTDLASHLAVCPVCRETQQELREMRNGLSALSKANIPVGLAFSLKEKAKAAAASARGQNSATPEFIPTILAAPRRSWLMPTLSGAFASLIVFLFVFNILTSDSLVPRSQPDDKVALAPKKFGTSSIMLATNAPPSPATASVAVTAADLARSRSPFTADSPTINPKGGILSLADKLVTQKLGDQGVVVVANVLGNGSAEIETVIEPDENAEVIAELKKAFIDTTKETPFVPSSVDERPDNMKIVMIFRTVDVSAKQSRNRR